jgi:hypothetical protein
MTRPRTTPTTQAPAHRRPRLREVGGRHTRARDVAAADGDVAAVGPLRRPARRARTRTADAPRSTGLLVDGSTITSDADKLAKVSVSAEVVKPAKGPKITILKYKNKTGYRKRQGHRQPLLQVKITAIGG